MAAPAFVQEVAAGTKNTPAASSLTISVTVNTGSANTLILCVDGRDDTVTISSITDSRGNAWFSDVDAPDTPANCSALIGHGYMDDPLLIGDSIFVTFSGALGDAVLYWVEEFAGIFTALTALDQTGIYGAGGDATPTVSAGGATSQANAIVITSWITDDMGVTLTEDGSMTPFPTGLQATSGASPGDRQGLAAYRIVSSSSTEASTITLSGSTNIAGAIAVYKAAADSPGAPVGAIYGIPWAGDSLANLEMGRQAGRHVAIRWRSTFTGSVTAIWIYHKAGAGYSLGTGGHVRMDIQSDDGTASHFPSGTVLATSGSLVTANTPVVFQYPVTVPITLTAGTIYHFVFTNTDATPTANYVSKNSLDIEDHINPIQKTISNDDLAVVWQDNGPPWVRHPDRTPIFTVDFADGTRRGQSYYDVLSVSGLKLIQGANNMVRLTFTPSQSLSVGRVWFRGWKLTGETVALLFSLKTSGGSTISSASLAAASIAVGTPGDPPHGAAWYSVDLGAQALAAGTTYRLELSCAAGATGYNTWPITAGGGAFGVQLVGENRFTDGYLEFTTTGSAGWAMHAGNSANKPQIYFETSAPAAPPGAGHSQRTLTGVGA